MRTLAAIELGSHTARLLIAEASGSPVVLRPLAQGRGYVRAAEGFDASGSRCIDKRAFSRTADVLEEFSGIIDRYGSPPVHAVATGVVREALNRKEFLDHLHGKTSIRIAPISGTREALLTGKGVLHGLGIQLNPFFVFDLGGGSTECVYGTRENEKAISLPLGASLLTQAYLGSAAPSDTAIKALLTHVRSVFRETLEGVHHRFEVAGTGGTVVSLAGVVHDIPLTQLTPEAVNGLVLTRGQVEECLRRLRHFGPEPWVTHMRLDKDRAEVILGGTLVVKQLMEFLNVNRFLVSMSDLLEGILIEAFFARDNGHDAL